MNENIGMMISVALTRINKTQQWLAEKLETDQSLVSAWVTGKRKPHKSTIDKIISVFKTEGIDISGEDNISSAKETELLRKENEVLKQENNYLREENAFLREQLAAYKSKGKQK